mmetsp:Transcript_42702/g.114443  ORF Transcript_42702/g.114443 Transcript_42702/m.114443 type:complete len:208 (+) Transcript_42702:802-1425(+)
MHTPPTRPPGATSPSTTTPLVSVKAYSSRRLPRTTSSSTTRHRTTEAMVSHYTRAWWGPSRETSSQPIRPRTMRATALARAATGTTPSSMLATTYSWATQRAETREMTSRSCTARLLTIIGRATTGATPTTRIRTRLLTSPCLSPEQLAQAAERARAWARAEPPLAEAWGGGRFRSEENVLLRRSSRASRRGRPLGSEGSCRTARRK